MATPPSNPVTCPKCGVPVNESLRNCPTCEMDLGCPNVRAATAASEVAALTTRFLAAEDDARQRGVFKEFSGLADAVSTTSHVVVAMPPFAARTFLSDPRSIYSNYEKLVGSQARTPAPFVNDSDRYAVSGKLFGSYAEHIRYGVLSLDRMGLPSYGSVFLTLRDIAIQERVSFLHENSYMFLDTTKTPVRSGLPLGYKSGWHNRHELAASKMEPHLAGNSIVADWARQLVVRGADRSLDKCVEAHIYGGFNRDAVESIEFAGPGSTRAEKNDVASIKELAATLWHGGATP